MVVSTEGKGLAKTRSGDRQEEDRKGTAMEVSKTKRRCQNRGGFATAGPGSDETCFTGGAASGMRCGLSLPRRRLSGTWEPETPMRTEKPQVAEPQGREYGSGDSGAEQRVVAGKSPIKGWSEGAVSRSRIQ